MFSTHLLPICQGAENSTLLLSRTGLWSVHDKIDLKQTRDTHTQIHKHTRQKHTHIHRASEEETPKKHKKSHNSQIRNILYEPVYARPESSKMSEFGPILAKPSRTKRVKAKATYGHGRVNISALRRIILQKENKIVREVKG